MTLPEHSLFSFWLSLGGGRGFLGRRVARVEKCLNDVLDVRQPSGGVVGSRSVAVRCVRSGAKGGEGKKGTVFMLDSTRVEADGAAMPAPMSTSFRLLTVAFAMAQYHGVSENSLRVLAISFIHGSFENCMQV